MHQVRSILRSVAVLFVVGAAAATTAVAQWRAPIFPTIAAVDDHAVGQSYMFLRVYEDSLLVTLEITVPDLEKALGLGWNAATVKHADVAAKLGAIRAYMEPRFALRTADGPLTPTFRGFDMLFLNVANFVLLKYAVPGTRGIPANLTATYDVMFDVDAKQRNFLVIEHNWKTFNSETIVGGFSPDKPELEIDLSSSSSWRGFLAMVRQGVWHIWIGIDHILFLIALALPAVMLRAHGRWEPVSSFRAALIAIVTIVSFFTLAHSITLSLAALDIVRLPSRIVESIIAASIAVAAWANLVPKLKIREAALAFSFGLFHGFGFATVLGDLGLGREHMVLSLLGFNIGVELGQLAIICAVFPILFLLRQTRLYPWIMRVGSSGLIVLALIWLYERAFDVNVPIIGIVKRLLGLS
jgi:hypothetical protein